MARSRTFAALERRFDGSPDAERDRAVPVETPVAIEVNGLGYAVMMATPDDIADFAYGFALSEGIISELSDVAEFETVTHARGIEARIWLRTERSSALKERQRSLMGPTGCAGARASRLWALLASGKIVIDKLFEGG